jgi:macrolide transport system ATP-binding/permease protein
MLSWLRVTASRVRSVVTKERLDREFNDELQEHLQMLTEEYQAKGMPSQEARRTALMTLGHPEELREANRESRGMPVVETLAKDLRFSIRTLRKSPGFTIVAVLSLALGIGANSALFSLVDALLLKTLPVKEPDRLVTVTRMMTFGGFGKPGPSMRSAYEAAERESAVFADVMGYVPISRPVITIDGAAEPERNVWQVTPNFFTALGLVPFIGSAQNSSINVPAAVIGYTYWQSRFNRDPNVLQRSLDINGRNYAIIGVTPPRFSGLTLDAATDVWLLTPVEGRFAPMMIARLQPGVDIKQAHARMDVLFRQEESRPDSPKLPPSIVPRTDVDSAARGLSFLREQYQRPLIALMVLVTLVLLITCTNIGNLLVVRNSARTRELTLRTAMGAGRSRLITQLMVESMVLAMVGGVLAWVVAKWGVAAMLSMLPLSEIPPALEFQMDARMLAFTATVSILSAGLFALAPAWRATKVDVATGLKSAAATATSRETRRLGRWLVAGQIALSVVLLTGAALFLQSLRNMTATDPGFDPGNLVQVEVDTRGSGYGQGKVRGVYRQLLDRLGEIPGVLSVTAVRNPLMTGALQTGSVNVQGVPVPMLVNEVGPKFFETMRVPLVRGRYFSAEDGLSEGTAPVIVNETFARMFIPAEDPIGARIDSPAGVVIGVVKEARLSSLRAEGQPMAYTLGLRREPDRVSAFEIRTASDPRPLIPAMRRAVTAIHPRLLLSVRTMDHQMARNMSQERMVAGTSAFFGILGVILAAIGLFGVVSFTVSQRTSEWGIRIALGAGRWNVIRESVRDTATVFVIGLIGGAIAATIAARFAASRISGLLFGLTATDWTAVAAAAVLMITVATVACVIPALRATRVDPLKAIRYE